MASSIHQRPALVGAVLAACLLALPVSSRAQGQPLALPPAAISPVEAAAIAQFWVLLAEGKFDEAAITVGGLASRYPRNIAVLTLLVETDIARGGALTALNSYEIWLGTRTVEEPGVLRRIARAVLYEWARQTADGGARNDALMVLANDGDMDAAAAIAAMRQAGDENGLRASVRMGDPAAVEVVAGRVRQSSGLKLRDLQLLAESHSPAAIPVLVEVLKDMASPENRAAAADALGKIGGPEAERALLPVLADPHGLVRTAAAAGLFKMGNFSGAAILNELAASEHSSIRRTAAMFMASQPDEAWKTLVRGLLNDPDPTIRLDAALMIAPHDAAAARSVLDALNADPNPAIREATQMAEADQSTSSLPTLRSLMRRGDPMARIRAAARVLTLTR